MIYQGNIDFHHDSSPFAEGLATQKLPETLKDAINGVKEKPETKLSDDDIKTILLARAVQAFEYVGNNNANGAAQLKSRLSAILEGQYFGIDKTTDHKLWSDNTLKHFGKYYQGRGSSGISDELITQNQLLLDVIAQMKESLTINEQDNHSEESSCKHSFFS